MIKMTETRIPLLIIAVSTLNEVILIIVFQAVLIYVCLMLGFMGILNAI